MWHATNPPRGWTRAPPRSSCRQSRTRSRPGAPSSAQVSTCHTLRIRNAWLVVRSQAPAGPRGHARHDPTLPLCVSCAVHQPSIDIFEAFDELLLLKRGGEPVYVGPLGQHASQLIQYFEKIQAGSSGHCTNLMLHAPYLCWHIW